MNRKVLEKNADSPFGLECAYKLPRVDISRRLIMSKEVKAPETTSQDDAFEIIELAIDQVELLTRAFSVIEEVCTQMNQPEILLSENIDEVTVH